MRLWNIDIENFKLTWISSIHPRDQPSFTSSLNSNNCTEKNLANKIKTLRMSEVLLFLRNSSSDKVSCENRAVVRKIARNLVYSAHMSCNMFRQNVSMCARKLTNIIYLRPVRNAKIVGFEKETEKEREKERKSERTVGFLSFNSICEKNSIVLSSAAHLITNSENVSMLLCRERLANLTAHTWNNRREFRGENRSRVRNFARRVMAQRDLLKSTVDYDWCRYGRGDTQQNRFLVYFTL